MSDQALLTNIKFSRITATAIHETMHILGFNSILYETYLDPTNALGDVYSSFLWSNFTSSFASKTFLFINNTKRKSLGKEFL